MPVILAQGFFSCLSLHTNRDGIGWMRSISFKMFAICESHDKAVSISLVIFAHIPSRLSNDYDWRRERLQFSGMRRK
jgi:hypothetical protein